MTQRFTTTLCVVAAIIGRAAASSAGGGGGGGSGGGGAPTSPVKAVLFDFDGSLVQSEEHHRLSFSAALGYELDRQTWYSKCVGRRPLSILQEFRRPDSPPAEELAVRLVEDAVGRYDAVEATAGHLELLSDIGAFGLRTAIVSSGTRVYIERVLARLELAAHFQLIVAGDDPQIGDKHKPHPFPYLHAAEVLGVAPEDCIAVEDSPAGITSALRAGMRVIAVRNPANRGLPILDDALVVALVDDFRELPRAVFGCAPASAPAAVAAAS